MPAPPRLIVVGAGHIAVPLVKIAKVLDFHVTVIDDRLLYANRERFPDADEVLTGDMAQMLKDMTITPSCYIVLITRGTLTTSLAYAILCTARRGTLV
jgi:xanthine dehydrogenase accessory factor